MTAVRIRAATLERLASTRPATEDAQVFRRGVHGGRLLLLKSVLARLERRHESASREVREEFTGHWRLLERAERRHASATWEILGHPPIGNWLAVLLTASDGPEFDRHLGHFGHVAAAVALRTGEDCRITLPTTAGRLVLPGVGELECRADRVSLTVESQRAWLRSAGGGVPTPLLPGKGQTIASVRGEWRGLLRLPGGPGLLDDLDPYRVPPNGAGAAAALRGADRATVEGQPWLPRWRGAMELLGTADPQRAFETAALLRVLVPLASADHWPARSVQSAEAVQISATARSAPGAVLTTMPSSTPAMAETLVHEVHHTKLAVLNDLVPLYRPDSLAVHRVAWRPDPRPLAGVMQGTYSHLALVDLWQRLADRPGATPAGRRAARRRSDTYRQQVADALPLLLESDELTCTGRKFAVGMTKHHAGLCRANGPPRETYFR